ncbi:MAG: hypothetical protein HOP17_00245 [Acidobacteria bacterium]|nr:hypothetical protein [Acidobacteriota bacterium]
MITPPKKETRAKSIIRLVTNGSDRSAKRRCSFQGTKSRTVVVNINSQPNPAKTAENRIWGE